MQPIQHTHIILCIRACGHFMYTCTYSRKIQLFHFIFQAQKKSSKPVKSRLLSSLHLAGDERIELPPKVLETPIIPFDQSPILSPDKYLLYG